MPPRFAEAERHFATLRARYQAGELDEAAYDAELQRLVIEDDAGDYWMLGADSGQWYWYDGEQWVRRDPTPPDAPVQPPPPGPPPPAEAVPPSRPPASAWWKWVAIGCGGLVACLAVAGAVALVAYTWLRQSSRAPSATAAAVELRATSTTVPVTVPTMPPTASTPAAEPTVAPTLEPTPTLTPSAPFSIRPYDPDRDAGVAGILERVVDFAGATEPGVHQWDVTFPVDAPALISLGWCAVDQGTLDENWSQLAYELWVDGFPADLSQLTEATWTSDELPCRGYLGVVTGWERTPHTVVWTQRVKREINDGMDAYPAGDYVLRFDVEMVNTLEEDFSDASGGWLEGDYESDRIWIADGEYHILMKEPQRIAQIAHREDRYADFYLSAEARLVSEADGEYGVVFRYQDPENTYTFRVSPDGRYRIGKRVEGEWIDLVEWTLSESINQAQSENTLWLFCQGDSITAYVNSEEVAAVTDDTFTDGYIGVMAGSFSQPDAHIAFDRIFVEATAAE
jgi:hypothetical protein